MNMNHVLGYTVWLWGLAIIPIIDSMWSSQKTSEEKSAGLFSMFREMFTYDQLLVVVWKGRSHCVSTSNCQIVN